jgi:NitT/TauT family transport system substrate-binding protein
LKKSTPFFYVVPLFLLLVGSCRPAAELSSDTQAVVIAQAIHSPGYAPLYIAQEKGFFSDEKLQVEFLRGGGGSKAVMLLLSGDAQFAVRSAEVTPVAQGRNIDLLTVQALYVGLPFQLIIRKEAALKHQITPQLDVRERLKRVQGLTFATTTRGGASAVYTHYLFHAFGLDPEEHIDTVYMGNPQARIAAFRTGEAQLTTAAAENKQFLDSGEGVILVDLLTDFPPIRDLPFLSVHTLVDYARQSPETVRKVVRAFTRAHQFIRDYPEESLSILETVFAGRYESEQLAHIFQRQVVAVLPQNPRMNRKQWDSLVEVARAVGILTEPLDTTEGVMWTNEFASP